MASIPKRVEDRLVAGINQFPPFTWLWSRVFSAILRARRNVRVVTFLGLTVFFVGCATDVANRYYLSERYPERDPKTVELLSRRPDRPYVVMADFQSRGESPEDIRKKAAKIGADAVIIATIGGLYSRGTEWAGEDKHSDTYSHITGTAILYEKPSTK
jgi:hypothetical protein